MDQLDEALRDAVILYYFRDMPLKKIAELLETSEGAVKNRLYRARHILAKRLDIDTEREISYET